MALAALVLALGAGASIPAPAFSPTPSPTPTPQTETGSGPAAFQGGAVVVRGRRLPDQVSERSLKAVEARRVPGAGGDIVRALAALPGAVTANDFLANLLVRGGGFDDNLVLLDGVPAAYPFHFGGLESVFHPGVLEEALFLPGAFDVRFGDTLGGVLDLRTRRPPPGLEGEAGLSLIQATGRLSAGGPGVRAQAAYRRGWLDLVLPAEGAFVGLPRWQDHHAQWAWDWGPGEARMLAFGSRDALVARGGPGSADSRFDSAFDALGLAWRSGPAPLRLELRASASRADVAVDLGPDLRLRRRPDEWSAAAEADWLPGDGHAVNAGAQWRQTDTRLQGRFARLPVELGTGLDFSALERVELDALGRKGVASLWMQDRWQPLPRAAMALGARYDRVDPTGEFHLSPRWSLELGPFGASTLRLGVGDYFQSPHALETVPGWAGTAARSSLVRSHTVSLQQGLGPAELRLEAYRKDFERRIPERALAAGLSGTGGIVLNAAGTGWAEGAEALLRLPPLGRFGGWLSYAWSSVIRGDPARGYHDADFSQPHVGNLVLEAVLPLGLRLGGRWRVASGIPYTPVDSRSFDAGEGRWTPRFGAVNSARLPAYQRLDLRLEKVWRPAQAAWWRQLTAFVEAFNVTDAENVTSVTYEDDYSGIRRIRQFPRLLFGGLELGF